jgi:hypothetical protein
VLVYAGKEHPCLSRENGRILYITYVEFEEYYPHLLEVSLDVGFNDPAGAVPGTNKQGGAP